MSSKLLAKKREEILVIGSERMSVSYEDVLIEDFFEDPDHPYAVYSRNGILLETNLNYDKDHLPLWHMFRDHMPAINNIIDKYGVNV